MKITIGPGNKTHDGSVSLDFFEDVYAPKVWLKDKISYFSDVYFRTFAWKLEVTVILNSKLELVRRTISPCNFLKQKNLSFITNFFFDWIRNTIHKDYKFCPGKKGSVVVTIEREKLRDASMSLPAFIEKGQTLHLKMTGRGIVKSKSENLFTLLQEFTVVWLVQCFFCCLSVELKF